MTFQLHRKVLTMLYNQNYQLSECLIGYVGLSTECKGSLTGNEQRKERMHR